MEKLCRLCLTHLSEDSSAVSVFSKEKGQDLSEMIFICTSILVKQDNKQPSSVCINCLEALIQCHYFREKCLKADRQLVQYWERQSKNQESNLDFEILTSDEIKTEPRDTEPLQEERCSETKPVVENQPEDITNCNNNNAVNVKKKKVQRKSLEAVRESHDISEKKCKKKPKEPVSFKCEYCEKIYPSEGGWRYHVHTMHSQSYQPFICNLCGKAFKAKKNMEVHKRSVHFKLKEHLCDLCGDKFATKYGLRVHQVWHTGEKKYECEICEARFASKGKLNTHLNIHEGFKKFMCEVCSRVFRWKKDFVVHMRTHTGEKPYACKICNKAFASLTNMRKHESSHANSKHVIAVQKAPTTLTADSVEPGLT